MKRYRLYVDESGDHGYWGVDRPANRYLCLLGLFVESEAYRTAFHPGLESLKQTHFPHSPDEPVILHRKELIKAERPFGRLREAQNQQRFNNDFLEFIAKQDYKLIGVVIDKKAHFERYQESAHHPYHYCFAALLEKYCGFLNFYTPQGDVLAESRGWEDRLLKLAYRHLYEMGTYFYGAKGARFFQRALTSREVKLKPKSANTAGLQVADLLAHPVKQDMLLERGLISELGDVFGREICRVIGSKFIRDGKVFLL